jgi:hypothetical protein
MGEFVDDDKKNAQFRAPETGQREYIPMEGRPGPLIEDAEKRKQPGERLETVSRGTDYYAVGMLVRDPKGRLGQVAKVELVETKWRPRQQDMDPFISEPERYTKPKVTVRYADQAEKSFTQRIPSPVYKTGGRVGQFEAEREHFANFTSIELRGHHFYLGELVSFGNGVGILAAIFPAENDQEVFVGIVAEEERGKGGPRFVWRVKAAEMDFIEHDENGAIRRNADNTIYKPTLR